MLWKYGWVEKSGRPDEGKWTKVPYQLNGRKAASTRPNEWSRYRDVWTKVNGSEEFDGIGMMLLGLPDFAAIDLDKVRDPQTGTLMPWVDDLITNCGSYNEVTPSMAGLRVLGGWSGGKIHRNGPHPGGGSFELFAACERFITFTGLANGSAESWGDITACFNGLLSSLDGKRGQAEEGADYGDSSDDEPIDIETLLPITIEMITRGTINGKPAGHRGNAFAKAVREIYGRGHGFEAALALLARYPDGVQAKYGGRLRKALAHWWTKIELSGENGEYLSEQWLAHEFATENHDTLAYTTDVDRWYQWDGSIWRRDDTLVAASSASRFCCRIGAKVDEPREAKRLGSARTRAAVITLAKEHLVVAIEEWNADPWLLGTPGGIWDLRTGRLSDEDRPYVNHAVRAAPQWPGCSCPLWLKTISEIFGKDDEIIAYMQRLAGYCLTGSVREEVLIFLHGKGGNGKGTVIETLLYIMGDYGVTVPMTTLIETRYEEHPTEIAKLWGARLAVATETKEGNYWDTGRIKALTGGDQLSGRFMRQDFFDFDPTHKLVVSSNNRPNLAQVDDAMRRRVQEVPFLRKFDETEADKKLKAGLREEAAGILGWMIEGCLEWQKQGLKPPVTIIEASRENIETADVLNQFIADCCVTSLTAKEPMRRFYAAWCKWCADRERPAGSSIDFTKRMVERWGYHEQDSSRHLYLVGLRVACQDDL